MAEATVADNIKNNPKPGPTDYAGGPFDDAPNVNSSLSDIISKSSKGSDTTSSIKKASSDYAEKIKVPEKNLKELMENPPKLAEMPKAPTMQNTDPWQTFGSPAMWLATFGSLFTRAPLTSALNAGAGVMKAQAAKDEAAYKKASDEFKFNMEQYWKLADYEKDVRKSALAENKEYANMLHTAFGDQTEGMIRETQGETAALKNQDARQNMDLKTRALKPYFDWQEKSQKDGTWNMEEDQKRFRDALTTKAMAEGKGITSSSANPLTPAAVDEGADYLEKTGKMPATARSGDIQKAILNRHAEKFPKSDMAKNAVDYVGDVAEARTVGTAAGRITLAANSLENAIPLAKNAMKDIDLSRFTSINQFENYAREHSGDPKISALNTALQTVMSDYSSLIARNGQTTEGTRAAARELINKNMAKGQLDAVFDQMEKEKVAQLKAIKDTKAARSGGGKVTHKYNPETGKIEDVE